MTDSVPVKYEFSAEIKSAGDGTKGGAYILFPHDVMECFGKKGRVPIRCTFDGVEYKGSLMDMGTGSCVGILKTIREKIGKSIGENVDVVLWEDKAERTIELPDDFAELLKAEPKAKEFFVTLSFTKKKNFVNWITDAKKEETRITRLNKVIELLLNNKGDLK